MICFVSSILPEKLVTLDDFDYSIAAQFYQKKVVKSFHFDKVISINYSKKSNYKQIQIYMNYIFYIYNFKYKLYNLIKSTYSILREIPNRSQIVFYNLTYRTLLIFIFAKLFNKCKVYVIVADYTPVSFKFNIYTNIFNFIISFCMKKANGLFLLNSNIKLNKNFVVQEAIIDLNLDAITLNNISKMKKKTILFSGSLGYSTGINLAIKTMDLLPEYVLHISGKLYDITLDEIFILINSSKFKNIEYHGVLHFQDYLDLLLQCEYALSLRNIHLEEHKYNFPSKIAEYLSYNKKVISTINYPSVADHIFYVEFNNHEIAKKIIATQEILVNSSKSVLSQFSTINFNINMNKLLLK